LLQEEMIQMAVVKTSIPRRATVQSSSQITTRIPGVSFFTGRMSFLPPSQQCPSSEGAINRHWYIEGMILGGAQMF